jgi:RES domain-containing protein
MTITLPRWEASSLPPGWDATPAIDALGQRGSRWIADARSVAVLVPSAVVPSEWNVLIDRGTRTPPASSRDDRNRSGSTSD